MSSSLQEITTRLYGQCWTSIPESDAFWRIYSNEKKGVRISTTVRKIIDLTSYSESNNDSICIGKVKYKSQIEIEESLKNCKYSAHVFNSKFFFESTLIKRNDFVHEKEIRIIHASGLDYKKDLKHYSIDPNKFIESIVLDSRISKRYEDLYYTAIKSMGYINRVEKSNLYEFKRLSIKIT